MHAPRGRRRSLLRSAAAPRWVARRAGGGARGALGTRRREPARHSSGGGRSWLVRPGNPRKTQTSRWQVHDRVRIRLPGHKVVGRQGGGRALKKKHGAEDGRTAPAADPQQQPPPQQNVMCRRAARDCKRGCGAAALMYAFFCRFRGGVPSLFLPRACSWQSRTHCWCTLGRVPGPRRRPSGRPAAVQGCGGGDPESEQFPAAAPPPVV